MKTLRDLTQEAIDNLSDFELAILRERVLTATEHVMVNKELIKQDLEKSGINPDTYIRICESIFGKFNFEINANPEQNNG